MLKQKLENFEILIYVKKFHFKNILYFR